MPWNRIPDVHECCGCIPDLRTAVAIIAVLGIVTSPSVSWAIVRHSYAIRVSCLVSTSQTRSDVVDVNLNNVLSFGFGSNAGFGQSCLHPKKDKETDVVETEVMFSETQATPGLVQAVQYIGWVVLISDLVFLFSSFVLLLNIFHRPSKLFPKIFIIAALVTMVLSFTYGIFYVSTCIILGGSFPLFEFLFAVFDLLTWGYFLIVVNSYRRRLSPDGAEM